MKLRGGTNPFYALLVIAGIVFVVTACAYGVMAFRQADPGSHAITTTDGRLLYLLDHYGAWILVAEVVLLGILTVGAISTDGYWDKRAKAPPAIADRST